MTTCSDCPAEISTRNKTGRCRACAMRHNVTRPHVVAARAARAAQRPPRPPRICVDCSGPISRLSKGRCQLCSTAFMNTDPTIIAKRNAALKTRYADPETRAAAAARMIAYIATMPEAERERRREHGRRLYRDVLSRPDVKAKSNSRETKQKASAARTETMIGWCPVHLRPDYHRLQRTNRYSAAEARVMIEQQMAAEERARIAAMTPFERQLERVRNGAPLVAALDLRRADPTMTLGGVATGLL